jgi:hypothetical protein
MYKLHTAQMSMTGNLRRRKKIARERERNNNYASKFIIYLFVYEPPTYTSFIDMQINRNSRGNRDLTIYSQSFIMIRHILSIQICRQHNLINKQIRSKNAYCYVTTDIRFYKGHSSSKLICHQK